MSPRRSALLLSALVFIVFFRDPAYAQSLTVTHLAGSTGGADAIDAPGTAARFNFPEALAVDGAGNMYVSDTSNHTIRKISASGQISTLAGLAGVSGNVDGAGSAARFNYPVGIAVDSGGNVYVADYQNGSIRKITAAGVVTTIPGISFDRPFGIAVDSGGNLFVTSYGVNTVYKVTPAGVRSVVAGSSFNAHDTDGTGTAAGFDRPEGITVDASGNLFVTDIGANTIRKIAPGGVVTTVAGNAAAFPNFGSTDGTGSAARFNSPFGIGVDSSGNLYVADDGNDTIRMITPGGVVTTLAGKAGVWGSIDATGSAARFADPVGIAVDSTGNVYASEDYAIRKITPGGVVATVAGASAAPGTADATAGAARFANPTSVAVDGSGNTYVADTNNNTIRKISPSGVVTTLAGSGVAGFADGTGTAAKFNAPTGVAVDSSGSVYVGDTNNYTIRKIAPGGMVTTLAGYSGGGGCVDGSGNVVRFRVPSGLAVDAGGNVYVADAWCGVRKVTPAGVVSTMFKTYTTDLSAPYAIAIDGSGNLYVADTNKNAVFKIAGGVMTTLAGGTGGSTDGTGTAASFNQPYGVTVDSGGNVYVADTYNHTIRKIATGAVVTTIAGTAGTSGSIDGTGLPAPALFNYPTGMAVDAAGSLYVADSNNNAIRKIVPAITDAATIDSTTGTTFQTRVLGTTPNTATAWTWTLVRRPVGSSAPLSSTAVQSPTFTPDASDLFVFRVQASNSSGARISTVSLTAAPFTGPFPSGDTNGDGAVNVRDVFYLINNLFAGGASAVGSADVNGDGKVNAADVIYLINYLFAGGTAPH